MAQEDYDLLIDVILNNLRSYGEIELVEMSHSAWPEPFFVCNSVSDGTQFELESGEVISSFYAPVDVADEDQGQALVSSRDLRFEGINDIIAEYESLIPLDSEERPLVRVRKYVGRLNAGVVSGVAEGPFTVFANSIVYSEKQNAALVKASTTPTNESPTGRRATRSRFPTLKGIA